jgi:signal transduction histidine kinase/DNA-binding response OmpR family regulator
MSIFHGRPVSVPTSPYVVADRSYFCIKDFRQVPTFAERPFVAGYPHMVSYIEIPLFARSGHILGSYCVVDTKERDFLHPKSLSTIREITSAISAYLDMRRLEACKSRSAEMMQGLRRFVAPERLGAHTNQFDLDVFGAASRRKPDTRPSKGSNTHVPAGSDCARSFLACDSSLVSPSDIASKPVKTDFSTQVDNLFTRAADNIGNAMDLDGLVFFDAVSTGIQNKNCRVRDASSKDTSSPAYDLFAVPLSCYQRGNALGQLELRQSLIQRLTARYPRGHVFAVDEYGAFQHGPDEAPDSAEDDGCDDLFTSLPRTRYVIFLPMFHYSREVCYATCLAWVSGTGKTLDAGDVNSLTAFGHSLMAEIFRLEASENTLSKSDFVSTISHELRSPLHGILASIELIQESCSGSDLMSEITMIESCAITLLDTFDHLLEYSKVNSRASIGQKGGNDHAYSTTHVEEGAAAVDLTCMVEDIIETVSVGHDHSSRLVSGLKKERQDMLAEPPETAQTKPVVVTTHFERVRNRTFVIEKGAWKRILLNVISNALKYTKSGYIHVDLEFVEATDDSQPYISLSVSDTGVGMSEDFLKYHLFTPFTQENILSPGAGLGLSLVKSIVESLHGTISVSSRLGQGTTIVINIPTSQTIQKSTPPGTNQSFSHDCLRGKSIGILSLSLHELGSKLVPSIASPPEALERSVHNICEDRFGMSVITVSTNKLPSLDILLVDAHAITSTLKYDLKTLFPTYTAKTYPTVVELGNTKGLAHKTGASKFMHTILVTSKSLEPALVAALEDSTAREMVDPVSSVEPEMKSISRLLRGDSALNPGPRTIALPHHNFTSLDVALSDAATSPLPQPASPTQPAIPLMNSTACRFRRLLLVDDNPINLKMLCAFAKRLDVPYSSATDGAEALRLYETAYEQGDSQASYDCIFMDISMPTMDGFQAVSRIRGIEDRLMKSNTQKQADDTVKHGLGGISDDSRRKRAYIFALTGLGSEKARKQASNSGFDEYLLKPVRFKDVLPLLAPLPTR